MQPPGEQPRGGKQRIPRPPGWETGDIAPWLVGSASGGVALARRRARPARRPAARPSRAGTRRRPRAAGHRRCSCRCSRTTARPALILTKRPETMPSHQGEIAFPGGKFEPAVDADLRGDRVAGGERGDRSRPGGGRDRRRARRHRHRRVAIRDRPVRRVARRPARAASRPARGRAGLRRRARRAARCRVHHEERWHTPMGELLRCTSSISPTRRSGAQPPGFSTVFCVTSSAIAECAVRER